MGGGSRLEVLSKEDSVLSVIARIKGEVWGALPGRIVVGAGGVGYQILVPVSTYDRLNPLEGEAIDLKTYQHVRENSLTLYGFANDEERDVFLLLIDRVSGIGPAIAMAVLETKWGQAGSGSGRVWNLLRSGADPQPATSNQHTK